MKQKRPKTVIVLLVAFAWSFFKALDVMSRASSADRLLYDEMGLGWLAIGLLTLIAALDLASIRYLIKPAPVGSLVCLSSIGLSALQTAIGFWIARMNPEITQQAFILSRQSRGLPVRQDAVEAIVDPTVSTLLWAGSLLVTAALAAMILVNRPYFLRWLPMPSGSPAIAGAPGTSSSERSSVIEPEDR
jgi:hypothetical protein